MLHGFIVRVSSVGSESLQNDVVEEWCLTASLVWVDDIPKPIFAVAFAFGSTVRAKDLVVRGLYNLSSTARAFVSLPRWVLFRLLVSAQ